MDRNFGASLRFFASVMRAIVVSPDANRRLRLVEKLQATSEAELNASEIERGNIVRHVFLDMRYA